MNRHMARCTVVAINWQYYNSHTSAMFALTYTVFKKTGPLKLFVITSRKRL